MPDSHQFGQRGGEPFFFFNDTATTEIYTLSLHDALPIFGEVPVGPSGVESLPRDAGPVLEVEVDTPAGDAAAERSEEHTSELQSRQYLVCRLLLEKKLDVSGGRSETPTCEIQSPQYLAWR